MGKLNKKFTAKLQKSPNKGGWTYVVMPGSFMALGDGTHKLPIKAAVRMAIAKEADDTVAIRLEERLR